MLDSPVPVAHTVLRQNVFPEGERVRVTKRDLYRRLVGASFRAGLYGLFSAPTERRQVKRAPPLERRKFDVFQGDYVRLLPAGYKKSPEYAQLTHRIIARLQAHYARRRQRLPEGKRPELMQTIPSVVAALLRESRLQSRRLLRTLPAQVSPDARLERQLLWHLHGMYDSGERLRTTQLKRFYPGQ